VSRASGRYCFSRTGPAVLERPKVADAHAYRARFWRLCVELTVTDQAGNAATSVTHIGPVATDDNGVVVNANPAADAILGPMIAFGQNPWGIATIGISQEH